MKKHLIVIVTHNNAAHVRETIGCVRAQTESDWHCTLVDNGSTDATAQIAQAEIASDPRFLFLQKDNEGPSAGRNLGYRHSPACACITFLDGDDLLAPTFLQRLGSHLDAHPACGVVSCQFDRMAADGQPLGGGFRSRVIPGFLSLPRQMKDCEQRTPFVAFFACTGQGHFAMFRRAVFARTTLYEESFWSHEDSDIFCQMSLLAECHALPERLYRRREHGRNLTVVGRTHYDAFRRKWDFYERAHPETAALIGPARRYYYRIHKPLRNFKVAATTFRILLRRPTLHGLRWMLELIGTALTGLATGERMANKEH